MGGAHRILADYNRSKRTAGDQWRQIHGRPAPNNGDAITAYICTVDVPAVDDYTRRAVEAGGQVCKAKMAVPGVGWLADRKDTEGNIFGLMQADPTAQ